MQHYVGIRRTVDVKVVLSKNLRSIIDRIARAVENTTQHVLRHRQLHATSSELDVRRLDIYSGRAFEYLDDSLLSLHL